MGYAFDCRCRSGRARKASAGWDPAAIRRLARRFLAGAAVLLSAVAPASAQHGGGPFGRYGPEHGLSSPAPTVIWQDRTGYLWIGTEDGLNRFDGHNFAVYRHEPDDSTSLVDSRIHAITEDDEGNLWIGTWSRGVNRLDPETGTFTRYPYGVADSSKGLPYGGVRALLYRDGVLWIGTSNSGVSRFDPKTGTYLHYDARTERFASFLHNDVNTLAADRNGHIWIGRFANGLSRLNPETHEITHYFYRPGDPTSIGGDRIRKIWEDHLGYLWIATSGGGLNRYDPATDSFKRYQHDPADPHSISHNTVWSVFEDSRGILWAGTWGGGLNRFDRASETFTRFRHDPGDPFSLPGDVVYSGYEDRSGLLWFATDNGVATYNPASQGVVRFRHDPQDAATLGHNDILSILPRRGDGDAFWVGTNRGGLSLVDVQTGRVTRVAPPRAKGVDFSRLIVTSLVEDEGGTLWIATKGEGLLAYTPATGAVRQYRHDPHDATSLASDVLTTVVVDREGNVWAGRDGGNIVLSRLDRETGVFEHYASDPRGARYLSVSGAATLHVGPNGAIWAGSNRGLSRIDPSTGQVTSFPYDPEDTTSLSHSHVYAIASTEGGDLWIGTYGGLNRLDPATDRITRYTVQNGLASNLVYGVVGGNDGVLWLTTSQGISRLDSHSGEITNFGVADGLPNVRFNVGTIARSARGDILIGGPNGLDVFHPSILQFKKYPPSLVITTFKKFGTLAGQDLRDDVPIRLSHEDTYFSFDFALLDYTNPPAHTFRYKLDGFDHEWQKVEGPIGTAHYRNDGRFGSFVFRVQGVDSKGRTNERRLLVVIVPPFWLTSWFRALTLFGAMVLAGSALAYGYRRKQQESSEKRRMLTEGREQERHFLARELHDVPLQNLYSVRHRLEVIARDVPLNGQAGDLEAARAMLEQTAEDLRRICGELRPPALGPFGLSKAIRSHLRLFEDAHPGVVVDFDLMPDGQRLPEPIRLALFRVYQSTLSNVARHASARHVWVRFRLTDQEVVLEVEDDGKGFTVPKNWLEMARQQHYGLLGIAEWVESIGGTLTVRSAPDEGALVAIHVPLPGERRLLLPPPLDRLETRLRRS